MGWVVTHFHPDRMGGIRALHARGIATWGTERTAELARGEGDPPPANTFAERLRLSAGQEGVVVLYPGPGHSPDNAVVWFPRRRRAVLCTMERSARRRECPTRRWP